MQTDINILYQNLAKILLNQPLVYVQSSQGGKVPTKELIDLSVQLNPKITSIVGNFEDTRKLSWKTLAAEFLWYMTGNNSSDVIGKYLPNWKKFTNPDGTVNSNYGKYWLENTHQIIKLFKKDKHTRQAVISIFDNQKRDNGHKDVPCTLSNVFIIRNNELLMINHMRSNDFWYGFPIDVFCATLFQKLLVNTLRTFEGFENLKVGAYIHKAASFHCYTNQCDSIMLNKIIDTDLKTSKPFEIPDNMTIFNFWEKVYEIEEFDNELIEYFRKHIQFDFKSLNDKCCNL